MELVVVLWLATLLVSSSRTAAQDFDLPITLDDLGGFDSLLEFLENADLDEAISAESGQFTLFAPTDDAFALLPEGVVECLLEPSQSEILSNVLLYHVIPGDVPASNLGSSQTALNSENLSFSTSNGQTIINGNTPIPFPDELASNGKIHVIESVLLPPSLDIAEFLESCQAVVPPPTPVAAIDDIAATVANSGDFTTLGAALAAANLNGTLAAPNGPYTVFAPIDDAFSNLPEGFLDCLLKPENVGALSNILRYHVISGSATSDTFINGTSLVTLNQEAVAVTVSDDAEVALDGVVVIDPNLEASNGVIHVIGDVLAPPSFDYATFIGTCDTLPTETPSSMFDDILTTVENLGGFDTLLGALDNGDFDIALAEPSGPFTFFAPTDAAFALLPPTFLPCIFLEENADALVAILSYHVVNGTFFSADISTELTTYPGEAVTFRSDGNLTVVNGVSTIEEKDIEASNGVVHILDTVLIPPSFDLSTFLVQCPETPQPTALVTAEPTIAPTASPTPMPIPSTIAETVASNSEFEILSSILETTALAEALSDVNSTYTIFAPMNEAFAALPDALIGCLFLPNNTEVLTSILEYHVLIGAAYSMFLGDGTVATLLQDGSLSINITVDGDILINDEITVVEADLEATNGVIHSIGSVLVPESLDLASFLTTCPSPTPAPTAVATDGSGSADEIGQSSSAGAQESRNGDASSPMTSLVASLVTTAVVACFALKPDLISW